MLLLAGLMGMMALGATALMGLAPTEDGDSNAGRDVSGQEDQADEQAVTDADAEENGTSILDFLEGETVDVSDDAGVKDENAQDEAEDGYDLAGDDYTGDGAEVSLNVADDATAQASQASSDAEDDSNTQDTDEAKSNEGVGERATVGTPEGDRLDGLDARDVANGYDGDDAMSGGSNDDELWGASGADTVTGGAGHDTLHGGAGDDEMLGEDGDDHMFGHGDDDTMSGGAGDDSLVGSEGDDALDGGAGDDAVHGDLGNDQLRGGAGHDVLFGGWGDDTLSGLEDDPDTDGWDDTDVMDFLNGGGGADMITAGAGDVVTTGDGADTVLLGDWLNAEHQAEILDFAPGEDTLMVVYNDASGDEPEVDLTPDPNDSTLQHVMLNGVQIASVNNAPGLNAGHITLIGSSMLPAGALL